MRTTASQTNRRSLILGAAAGVLAGGVWGAAIQTLATPSSPSLSIVGKRDAQIILLDTTRIRVLILLGIPDEDLQLQIPGLLTVLHQRIDILIGSSTAINILGTTFLARWRVTHSMVFSTRPGASPNTMTQTWIYQDLEADLGDGMSLSLTSTTRRAWNAAEAYRYLWLITLQSGASRVLLAPDTASATVLGQSSPSLVVLPRGNPGQVASTLSPASIATNARDDLTDGLDDDFPSILVRMYPQDIARFIFQDDSIELPSWAEAITSRMPVDQ